ncbi:Pleiotropic drug resistance protein 12 [Platanthera guangdongensis]|uniref:Pleiotropic drug resistance protein 12 n=1 Tax=Platanthera guangdongensis TaxID=2320717 RepID=A0ABR2LKB8_9ASPA
MEKVWDSARRASQRLSDGIGWSAAEWGVEDVFSRSDAGESGYGEDDDEAALRWAAIERLPTYHRLRTGILKSVLARDDGDEEYKHQEVDVRKLRATDRREFIQRVFRVADEDNERFLKKLRDRVDRVGMQRPTVEVRFENLTVKVKCHVGRRALPTLANAARNMVESVIGKLGIRVTKTATLTILQEASGVIRPSRMTLLLGPPSSGKTTLMLALAGKLDPNLKANGEITYNGHHLDEFVPRKTAVYISQNDVHLGEMTVKETLDFSARCQGIGSRYELLSELVKREKQANIQPEPELDLYMKSVAMEGVKSSLQTDYTLKILGLDICADTMVGDAMHRGISGGQKKRVTTGEMIVGPTKTLLMDEISTGLDSSTTFQIVKCMQQIVRLQEATILMSLLQPAPETFELFDDLILLSDGHVIFHGPRDLALPFFASCGFVCPDRKPAADFLQEVSSPKDQSQYWADPSRPHRFIPPAELAHLFRLSPAGQNLASVLSDHFDRTQSHPAALVKSSRTVPYSALLRASFAKESLLIRRSSVVYISKALQIILKAFVAATVFLRTNMRTETVDDGAIYIGALLFGILVNMFNGFAELSVTMMRLPVFYKQRDLLFYPAWVFTLPNFLLRIPISVLESSVWVLMTYFSIGFAPEPTRFFKQLLLFFSMQQMAAGLFRLIAGVCRSMTISNTGGSLMLLTMFILGGFILPKNLIPTWWVWGHWISPLSYGFNAIVVNEFWAPRWMNKFVENGKSLGLVVMENADVYTGEKWYWIGIAALIGFAILFNMLFTLAITYLNPTDELFLVEMMNVFNADSTHSTNDNTKAINHEFNVKPDKEITTNRGMVLPFIPLAMSFDEVNYYVDMPVEMKAQGVTGDRLQLLMGVTGTFRPGVLTALMGVSGAGKTTLMDVLAGRKTGGYIEGDIRVSGYPKKQSTFARISGYCEQNDIHSPQVTVWESLVYSAFLRLPEGVNRAEKMKFVDEVMQLVELDNLKDAIVGLPGITGLSTEQRKRLTIAVELVANPSIIFMDEPTSGLDARAAAIVMRTVRNTVDTGRTVVCTIHQPSVDIFEAFDELLLMKRGGQVIYFGPLGQHSEKLIEYFESVPQVLKITDKVNPATWMLDVSSISVEVRLGVDFATIYQSSDLYTKNKELINDLSKPASGTSDLHFPTRYSQSSFGQFKTCFWKKWWTYWRSPDYNLVRLCFTLFTALLLGSIFWKIGHKRESANDLRIVIGSMFVAVLFVGINNCSTVQPIVAIERSVYYRERAAGMYSALPYALAQVFVEIPYVLIQALYYSVIVYSMMSFEWTTTKFLWFYFISFFSFLYFTYYGMMSVSLTPNQQVAAIFAATFYSLFNLFSGFFIPRPKIPKWWVWYYWMCPLAWTVYGLIITQYGDLEDIIHVPGQADQPIKLYIMDYFGYRLDFMSVVAIVLVGFCVLFAFTFAFCIRKLNFQQR